MVKGVEVFRTFFRDFTDNYILIGGTACDEHLSGAGLSFRATRDLDIILIVEALNSEFVKKFWEFVVTGNYEIKQKSETERKNYRFLNPGDDEFPTQLELFARNPDLLDLSEGTKFTPIPTEEDLTSLSAILMNDDYYKFTIANSGVEDYLRLASIETLICLKAKAFLDLNKRKEMGETIDTRNIKKHKNDVIRLTVMLTGDKTIDLPYPIFSDMRLFIENFENDPPDVKAIGETVGLPKLNANQIIEQIKQTFSL